MAQPPWGGVSESGDVASFPFRPVAWLDCTASQDLVYLQCPACHDMIMRPPISRRAGLIPFLHYRKDHAACRLLVLPDAVGTHHLVAIVPTKTRLEVAFARALQARAKAA